MACVPWCGVFPISGGGVAVRWYPVGMWLLDGLGVLLVSFLHALSLWLLLLQCEQNTLVLHSCHIYPCSPHLKQVGVFLFPDEFGHVGWEITVILCVYTVDSPCFVMTRSDGQVGHKLSQGCCGCCLDY